MPSERCPTCSRSMDARDVRDARDGDARDAADARDDVERCDCRSSDGRELMNLPGPLAHRLARAWLSLGCGGLILFLTYALALGHVTWSGVTLWLAVFGGWLMLRGGRVVSKEGVNLLDAAAQAALPAARVVTSRLRGDTSDD